MSMLFRAVLSASLLVSMAGLLCGQSAPLTISPQSLPYGALGSSYNAQLTANNGSGSYQWSVSQGSLPPGLTLDPNKGTISGTPNTGGTYQFTVKVQDIQTQQTASQGYTVGILNITNSSPLPNGTTSTSYSVTCNAADGPGGNYAWSIDTPPPGLQLNGSTLSGTPTTAGTYNFTITVTVSSPPSNVAFPSLTTSKAFSLTIQPPAGSGLTISPSSLPFGALGSAYSAQLRSNGSGSYQWSVTQGSLPPGLTLGASSGSISGTASGGGTYSFVVSVTDLKTQQGGSAPFKIGILNISNASPLPSGSTMNPYSVTFNASDGPPGAATWSIDTPPPGLQLNGNVLSGNPSMSGTFSFNISVTVGGLSTSKAFALTIGSSLTITDPPVLPAGDVNVTYAYSFNAVGGPSPFGWGLAGGSPPAGIAAFDLSDPSVRTIRGTPTNTGTSTFTVQVQDAKQNITTKQFSLTINPALSISTASLPGGTTGSNYAQIVTATGGTPPYAFSIANPPPGMSIDPQTGLLSGTPTTAQTYQVTITVSDAARNAATGLPASTSKAFALTIGSSTAQVTVSPQSASFTGAAGGDSPPPQAIVALPVGIPSATFRLAIDAGQDGSAAPAWITVTPTAGSTPARLVIRVDQGSMPAGNYAARIRVFDSSNNPTDVSVTFAVTAAAPQLDAAPRDLHFAARIQSPGALEQIIVVRNSGGGGPLSFSASVLGASSWIAGLTPGSGQTAHNALVFLRVRVNTQGLQVGSYHDVIRLASAAGNVDVTVSLFVAASGAILGVDITGVTFHERQGVGSHSRTVNVLNLGDPGTTVNWSADLASGDTLVSAGPPSGTATPASPGKLTLTPNANAVGMAAGGYYELIRIAAPGSLNSPQYVVVVLDQESSSAPVLPDPSPAGLFFSAGAGAILPAQQVDINASASSPFQLSTSTTDGANWLSAGPASGSAGPISVSVNTAGLAPGIYTGEVDISIAGNVVSVSVTLAVRLAGTSGASMEAPMPSAVPAPCTPTKLALTPTGLVNNFSVPAKWPAALIVQLNNDCGTSVTNGSVVASFSNGDPPLSLRGDGQNGTYSATWQAGTVTPRMVVTLQAVAGTLQPATAQLTGGVSQNQAPVLAKGGTVNAFYRTSGALAPGTVAEVYGTGLAAGTVSTGAPPLPTQSNGTFVLVGGFSAPLFYLSDGQLDVQIPSDLAPTQQYAIVVSSGGALTLPDQIDLVTLQPGVSSFADGHIIAQHVDGTLIDANHPAKPGEAIVTYLLAMGPTNPSVPSGAPSPVSPLAVVTVQPTVTVDGQTADLLFAGLTPTYAGLYQINFRVPASAHTGDLTMVVMQNGVASNATLLPVSP